MIRDAETESLIKTYAKPIFNAAGLSGQAVDIHIINDRAFNAFVVDGHNMFIHAGALMDAKTPNQIIGVIAHESGHITGGHLARLRNQISQGEVRRVDAPAARPCRHGGRRCRGLGRDWATRHGRSLWRNRRRDAHGARLPAGRRVLGRPGRRHLSQCHPPIRTRTARDLGVHELKAVRRAGHQSLPAISPAPPAASRPASLAGRGEPVFRRQGPARASGPP